MAVLATQILSGNVGKVYDLRTVGSDNKSVIDFTVAVTPRRRDGDDWVDGETYWVNVTAWNRLADNIAKSLRSGDKVMVVGRTEMKKAYINKDGDERPAQPYISADFVGLDISMHPAKSDREARSGGGNSNSRSNSGSGASAAKATTPKKKVEDFDDNDLAFDEETPF